MDKHYGFIYLTIDLKNGKGYIGQHKIRNQKTLDPDYIGSGRIIGDIKKKYGLKRFNRQILYFCESKEELDEMEIYYINYFNAIESENFYNIAEGGTGGDTLAGKTVDEMKEFGKKMSKIQKELWANKSIEEKEEFSKKISKSCKKTWGSKSIEEKEKYNEKNSKIQKELWANKSIEEKEEFSKIMSIAVKKRYEDIKEREKSSMPGEKNPMVRSVYCNELNIIFSYVKLAEKYCINVLNSKIGPIGLVCNGKRKSTGNYNGTKLTWNWTENVDKEILDKAEFIDSKKYEEILSKNVNDCK